MKSSGTTAWIVGALLSAGTAAALSAAEEGEFVIGVRKNTAEIKPISLHPHTLNSPDWFRAGQSDASFREDLRLAALLLATLNTKESASDSDGLRSALVRERERCANGFLALLNWRNCPDPAMRRGALVALGICNPEPKVAGKALALSAIYEPDTDTRKVSIDLIKARHDAVSARTMLDTWKSAFDDVGLLATNEVTRKAAVAAMRDVGDKRVFQALLYYAMSEIRTGSAAPVRVDSVSIKGQGINLPIDLPVLDLIGVEGTITIPAMASLKQATGQDFGHNFAKWNDWISKQP